MINVLSYLGMNLQSEVCLWTLLGLVRTVFDATLFKVNANLKQVWQMNMPVELSMPVQRVLRTMISGIMLVQCFTVYVYLASYIVLLYPVFLEERPALVLPWLLLGAIRKLLCELLSLALGLGTCLLVGPARPPCVKFVVIKIISIMPAFYIWMLVLSYYHALKVASAFKTFPAAAAPAHDMDYGLELAIRRRRTKSLFGEALLRTRLITSLYTDKQIETVEKAAALRKHVENISPELIVSEQNNSNNKVENSLKNKFYEVHTNAESIESKMDISEADQASPHRLLSDIGTSEDLFGNDVTVPRDTDRINEQFGLMLLRISAYLKKNKDSNLKILDSQSLLPISKSKGNSHDCQTLTGDPTDTPPLIASSKGNVASYLRDYPHIFMKKSDLNLQQKLDSIRAAQSQIEGFGTVNATKERRHMSAESGEVSFDKANTQKRKRFAKQDELKERMYLESNDSKQAKQFMDDVYKNEDHKETNSIGQNNTMKTPSNDIDVSSSDSLSSIITRMKTHLSKAKSSRKRNTTTSPSGSTSSEQSNHYQNRKDDKHNARGSSK